MNCRIIKIIGKTVINVVLRGTDFFWPCWEVKINRNEKIILRLFSELYNVIHVIYEAYKCHK